MSPDVSVSGEILEAPRGARSRAATRARLLAAGAELFADKGLHGVTTHDVARRAGVAAGTFYLHFKNKRELFRQLARETLADLRVRLDAAIAGKPGREAAVRAHAGAMADFALENRALMRILFSADADAAAVESDVLGELADAIALARRRRIASGDHPPELDPEVLSRALVGMWARVIAWWVEDPSRAPRETVVETLTRIQLGGTHPR